MPHDLLAHLFTEEKIDAYAVIPFSACKVTRKYLLERCGLVPQSAVLFLVPYYAGETENLSRYASACDYHLYMRELFARLTPVLAEKTGYRYIGFADHSPIDERHAAALAGLGMLGDNGLLINEKYGSFVFIGELLTDAPPPLLGAKPPITPRHCPSCGACRNACPSGCLRGESTLCLSAVTQKKGSLDEKEVDLLLQGGSAWGCDICQEICPYNQRIVNENHYTPITYFKENRITCLRRESLDAMDDETFAARAFSFRGRAPLERNLELLDKK